MARGLFPSKYAVADALTLHGYQGALKRALYNQDAMAEQANQAVSLALSGLGDDTPLTFDAEFIDEMNKLGQDYSAGVYSYPPNAPVPTPPPAAYGASGGSNNSGQGSGGWDWSGVLKALVGPIAQGFGGRIAGQNPWAPPVQPQQTPTWVPFAIGGAVLLGVMTLARR